MTPGPPSFDVRALARQLTAAENGTGDGTLPAGEVRDGEVRDGEVRDGGVDPWVLGLTGPPGVGKSTLGSALVSGLRRAEPESAVAVLAVDPSSPYTGGALLGDRVRMQVHAGDPGVFIRSVAARGHLGGLSAAVPAMLRVLAGAGFGRLLIETVGVGQSEVEVATLADTTVVVLGPGMGDGVQAAKAGLLEVADVFVVNQADRPGADAVLRDLRQMLAIANSNEPREPGQWRTPIVSTVATTGQGVDELLDSFAAHQKWAAASGWQQRRRRRRARAEVLGLALARLRRELPADRLDDLADRVAERGADPARAAAELLAGWAADQRATGRQAADQSSGGRGSGTVDPIG